ncbi:hypothetical protein [Nocardia sp. NPDC056100]|uniref:hypothetical protein n=1 Tax=Nocardia sp. NPDC056100 TaxID=3345712 RepID=UPI0035E2A09D
MDEYLVTKDQQFDGFRQVWHERSDGVLHGSYRVYWGAGPVVCMDGQYEAGSQEGIWTYWDRDGKVERQSRFQHDHEIEKRTAPPWFVDVHDQ